MINTATPYCNLDPNLILEAIESIGFRCSGSLLALNSFENRVYQVGIEESQPIIAKFYRPQRWENAAILEEHRFSLELQDSEIPIVAPLRSENAETLHTYQDYRFALFPRKGGRALELENVEQLEWMGRFIGRLHAIGKCRPFLHRPQLDPNTHGYIPFRYLIEKDFIPAYLKTNYCHTVELVLQKIEKIFKLYGPIDYIRLHGDCHAGNILWNDAGPHIVDLDDSVMGPAIQDIWMLLSGNPEQMRMELNTILEGYCEFTDFNFREINLIEALRTLRMIQYSAWLACRWDDPAFPLSFPWFNTPHYWQEQLQNLLEQSNLLDEVLNHCLQY